MVLWTMRRWLMWFINPNPKEGTMDVKWKRSIEKRLSRLEEDEKARSHRIKVIRIYATCAIAMFCGLMLAAGINGLIT